MISRLASEADETSGVPDVRDHAEERWPLSSDLGIRSEGSIHCLPPREKTGATRHSLSRPSSFGSTSEPSPAPVT